MRVAMMVWPVVKVVPRMARKGIWILPPRRLGIVTRSLAWTRTGEETQGMGIVGWPWIPNSGWVRRLLPQPRGIV